MKKYLVLLALVVGLAACSDNFLTRYPQGGTILEDQYNTLANALDGTMLGIYTLFSEYGGDHQTFGKRSIDMISDMLSGDMALTKDDYGWFRYEEYQMSNAQRTLYLWSYYYGMIRSCNTVIKLTKNQGDVRGLIAKYGLPTKGLTVQDNAGKDIYTYSEQEAEKALFLAQALTIRGYAYSQLAMLYNMMPADVAGWQNTQSVPIYTEATMDEMQGRATLKEVYDRSELDLEEAIDIFEGFESEYTRLSKNTADVNLARAFLAYAYLNEAVPGRSAADYQRVLELAQEIIDTKEYQIIPNDKLLKTGFNNIADASWMWGQDVTIETSVGLPSFFGQVDIHTYSYAWSGDTKVIDDKLYEQIPVWDGRKHWFNDGKADSRFKLCPDGKFFSALSPHSTKDEDIDREWLSDDVFMRIESIYLIAAEAAWRLGDAAKSTEYLNAITDQRLNLNLKNESDTTGYGAYQAELLKDTKALEKAIIYNWRVEMWGEGYGLQTFRRLTKQIERRGGNHLYKGGGAMNSTDNVFTFIIPASEILYNPNID